MGRQILDDAGLRSPQFEQRMAVRMLSELLAQALNLWRGFRPLGL